MTNKNHFLIGSLGSIGSRHLSNLRRLCPNAQIGALRQRTPISNTKFPDNIDIQFDSLEKAITFSPAAAIIAGPATTHIELAQNLARAGIDLFIEKPFSNHLEGTIELIDICQKNNLVLMIGYNLRFLPSLIKLKDLLSQKIIGNVISIRAEVGQYLPDWRPSSDYRNGVTARKELGGGVLLELSHELDYLYWLFELPTRVTAKGGHYSDLEIDVEDNVELILEYSSPRCLASIHLDMVQRTPRRGCRLIGTEGTLVWDGITDHIELYRSDSKQLETFRVPALPDRNQMYLDELSHFLDCVQGRKKPLINGIDGYNVLAIIEAAQQSMEKDTSIEVKGYAS